MSNVTKLSLAVVLALAAAALNAMWLNAEKKPTMYVAAAGDLPAGQQITEAILAPVPVPGDPDHLRKSLIPFGSRSILLGMTASRNYIHGDMFFSRDIKAPQELAAFEVLGPFKLISVGSRFTQANGKPDESVDAGGNNITIALNAGFDERARRLLQIIDPGKGASRTTRIIAVQVIPKEEQGAAPLPDDKNVVYQTVQLDGIANVPRVLLAGDVIRFVIPASDSL